MAITINTMRCPQNHRCPSVGICPTGAIRQQGNGAPTIDEEKCVACGRCLMSCPFGVFSQSA